MRLPFLTDWRTRRQARGAPPVAGGPMAAAEAAIARARAGAPETLEARVARWRRWWALQPVRSRDELDREEAAAARAQHEQAGEEIAKAVARDGVWSASWQQQDRRPEEPGVFWTLRL